MNYTDLFAGAWKTIWRSRFLLVLGVVTSLGSSGVSASRFLLGTRLARDSTDPLTWLAQPDIFSPLPDLEPTTMRAWLLWGSVAFLVLFLGLWVIALVAEGAQIKGVILLQQGQPVTMGRALRSVRRFLARFVGIDTIVFLPLFLLSLLILLLMMGGLISIALVTVSGGPVETAAGALAVTAICMIPLLCLLLPAGFLSVLFRTLAFRDAVLKNHGVRDSIRHAWNVMKANAGAVAVLVVLLWGLRYLVSFLVGLGTIPLTLLLASPDGGTFAGNSAVASLANRLSWILMPAAASSIILVNAIINAFSATVWTMAYVKITDADHLLAGKDLGE